MHRRGEQTRQGTGRCLEHAIGRPRQNRGQTGRYSNPLAKIGSANVAVMASATKITP